MQSSSVTLVCGSRVISSTQAYLTRGMINTMAITLLNDAGTALDITGVLTWDLGITEDFFGSTGVLAGSATITAAESVLAVTLNGHTDELTAVMDGKTSIQAYATLRGRDAESVINRLYVFPVVILNIGFTNDTILTTAAQELIYTKAQIDYLLSQIPGAVNAEVTTNKTQEIDTETPSADKYPSEAALVAYGSGKVDKVKGKVLSDNNFTTAEKNKLAAVIEILSEDPSDPVAADVGRVIFFTGTTTEDFISKHFYKASTSGGGGASGYLVSGAGMTAVNGVYTPNGETYNGQPVYAMVSGETTYYLYYQVDDDPEYAWVIYNAKTDSADANFEAYYHCKSAIDGTWSNSETYTPGTSPAPTVAAYSPYSWDDVTDDFVQGVLGINTSTGSETKALTEKGTFIDLSTKESTANKATDFSTVNNVKFPTTQAVKNFAQNETLTELTGADVTVAPWTQSKWSASGVCSLTASGWAVSGHQVAYVLITLAAEATLSISGATVADDDALSAAGTYACYLINENGTVRFKVAGFTEAT